MFKCFNLRENSMESSPRWEAVVAILLQNETGLFERRFTRRSWSNKTCKNSAKEHYKPTNKTKYSGEFGNRTRDFVHAKHALYQLS